MAVDQTSGAAKLSRVHFWGPGGAYLANGGAVTFGAGCVEEPNGELSHSGYEAVLVSTCDSRCQT